MTKWVDKVWGREAWLCNTPLYCAKWLYLSPGYRCSLHRHIVKDETFIVFEGRCKLEVADEVRYLECGDTHRIRAGEWHRFSNEGSVQCRILEVSTHHDDEDVERRDPSGALS